MSHVFCQYFRCPEHGVSFSLSGPLSEENTYFKFEDEVIFGRVYAGNTPNSGDVKDMSSECIVQGRTVHLPFDPSQVVNNLRLEAYTNTSADWHPASSLLGRSYYFLRPLLPINLRRHLQKFRLNGWRKLPFPKWPVDRTVDNVMEKLLLLPLRHNNHPEIPFIWFWPDGASSCAVMTHDVETSVGRDFCPSLMDLDDLYGMKASFQVVPESRYNVSDSYLASIRERGFEINVQDLNHDGHLFRDRKEFLARAARINRYGRQFGAQGFRSAVLYRRQEWYDALEFSYDMSVPNVAHLDPQRGGCCTVMPYFVGDIVELPVTITQDYSLFHILEDHSIELWRRQIDLVMEKHGLMNFIIHPDYIIANEERATFESLLAYLAGLRAYRNVWMPLPREVASWWRQRSKMRLTEVNGTWQIEGEGKERARIAYASEKDGRVSYSFESATLNAGAMLLPVKREVSNV